MSTISYWKLSEELNIQQATLLMLGIDPSDVKKELDQYVAKPQGYEAFSSAIKNAILNDRITAKMYYHEDSYSDDRFPDWSNTTLDVISLTEWLKSKGIKDNFFNSEFDKSDDFMDKSGPFYAPKLAAAVSAWRAVGNNPELLKNKSPKQALEKYLRENAGKFGLTKDDGSPNEKGIQEISKVANWNLAGGVAKTHTPDSENLGTPSLIVVKPTTYKTATDEDIPF